MNEGRIGLVLRLLAIRYGQVSPADEERVRGTCSTELDGIAERLLTAASLQEALGELGGGRMSRS